jgi:dTDP-4-dehydrorhamnose 3,5-epimerase
MLKPLEIPDVLLVQPNRHHDSRGFFVEMWSERVFDGLGLPRFVQDNEALSIARGTIRGLHYQFGTFAQAKLVRCVRGAIADVVVDMRRGSPTFGKAAMVELSAEQEAAVYIPVGFAHGYCTRAPETLVQYKVSRPYSPEHEGGIAWDDPDLGIVWPVLRDVAIVSDRDKRQPRLAEISSPFLYDSSRK